MEVWWDDDGFYVDPSSEEDHEHWYSQMVD